MSDTVQVAVEDIERAYEALTTLRARTERLADMALDRQLISAQDRHSFISKELRFAADAMRRLYEVRLANWPLFEKCLHGRSIQDREAGEHKG